MARSPKPRRDSRSSELPAEHSSRDGQTKRGSGEWHPAQLRIVGGELRGHRFQYSGDPRVRPMKDRVREALFNLVGPAVRGTHALDLFGGTGAVAFEAISRGARHATIVEQHLPTVRGIRENAAKLRLTDRVEIHHADAFAWSRRWLGPDDTPWTIFCCPPYRLFTEQSAELRELLTSLIERAPEGSIIAVESDDTSCFAELPTPEAWDVRSYPPAVIGILRK